MNPFSPTRNFVMHQPVTALTVRILILLLLAVPLVLLCRKAAEHAGYAKRRGAVYGVLGVLLLCVVGNATALLSVCGFAPVGIPLEPFMYSMFDAWVFAVGLLLLLLAHRRAVRGRKDKARQNRISLLLALVVAADLWRCHYNIVWWQNNQLRRCDPAALGRVRPRQAHRKRYAVRKPSRARLTCPARRRPTAFG